MGDWPRLLGASASDDAEFGPGGRAVSTVRLLTQAQRSIAPVGLRFSQIPGDLPLVRTVSSSGCGSIGVDGLLLSPAEGTDPEIIHHLRNFWMPLVQVLRRLGRGADDHVGADFRLGVGLAAEHLIQLGHRRIAFIGGGRHASPARDRARAYRETLSRHGLPVGPIVDCLPTRDEGERAVAGGAAIPPRSSATTTFAPSACSSA